MSRRRKPRAKESPPTQPPPAKNERSRPAPSRVQRTMLILATVMLIGWIALLITLATMT